jgi:ParB family chromosome partitioning protein
MTKETVKSAIGIDDALLSKMLSVIETIPLTMTMALGASKKIGRDKWLSLRQLILNPAYLNIALEKINSEAFMALPEEDRFDALHDYLKKYSARSTAKAPAKAVIEKSWASDDKSVRFSMKQKPKSVAIELTSAEARPFSDWLSGNMDRFYQEYKTARTQNSGD